MTDVSAEEIAAAFDLSPPIGPLRPLPPRSFVQTWWIETGAGAKLIKRFWPHDDLPWRDRLERVMALEHDAVNAGIDTPAPLQASRPIFGSVARIEGRGLFRGFPYLEHRPLSDHDDVAAWIGSTLAQIHQLHPLETTPSHPNWWYGQDPPTPETQWLSWLEEGDRKQTSWAPILHERLPLVIEQAKKVTESFYATDCHVMSHLDVEPWNVLMTADGPVLIDWDSSGPENPALEAAYVFTSFASRGRSRPDPTVIGRSLDAYIAAGGQSPRALLRPLDRVIGRHLATISTALGGYFAGGHSDDQIKTRLQQLPAVIAAARSSEQALKAVLLPR